MSMCQQSYPIKLHFEKKMSTKRNLPPAEVYLELNVGEPFIWTAVKEELVPLDLCVVNLPLPILLIAVHIHLKVVPYK